VVRARARPHPHSEGPDPLARLDRNPQGLERLPRQSEPAPTPWQAAHWLGTLKEWEASHGEGPAFEGLN
jgi:hypothetical protein